MPGDASIRVLVRSDRLNIPSASTPLEYEISQAQNPSLTIASSADPITYGQSATISGVLAGATTPQTVTLLARTVHQHGFAPIAEVSTGAGGDYSFPAQAPVNSTSVPSVQAPVQKSAVLYEGVKNVLTAEVSPTTVQAGEALTFKGTVAPDHTGHIIYLERQNAAGTAFHVVQVGHVLPGSVYSIVHQVYVPGHEGLPDRHPRRTGQRPRGQPAVHRPGDPRAGVGADPGGAGQLVAAVRRPDDGIGNGNTALANNDSRA